MACRAVLGDKVFDGLESGNIGLPRIHDMAIRKAFLISFEGTDAVILKECALYLDKYGMYEFYK